MKPLVIASAVAFAFATSARADDAADLKAKLEALQKQIEVLKGEMDRMSGKVQKQEERAAATPPVTQKQGPALTFGVGGGEVTLYGHIDVSTDSTDNGLSNFGSRGAVGKNGWLGQLSSNLSYFGIRGNRELSPGLKGIFQFETEVDYTMTPGTTSTDKDASKTGLGSRNSFVGLQGGWGAVKAGKTDAPYKTSTARMDPFSSTVGDYNSIMGNSGGDNRAEFDTRVPHAVWYESPEVGGGFHLSALLSPGQNRSSTNDIAARGEPNCTGGNSAPAVAPGTCQDGAFGTLFSVSGTYSGGPLYAIAAYESHNRVNRLDDEATAGAGNVGIANETAFKVGAQYKFPTSTTVNLILERLRRNAPSNFNERQRNGSWFAVTQKFTSQDDLNFGWAHAGRTPGDPGAAINQPNGTAMPGPIDNASNMFSLGYKHHFADKRTSWYAVAAEQRNHPGSHFDLGASGHGITTDCHDAANNCFAGGRIKAVSIGLTYDF
jgi:predicted porin